jgi:hypothetical protein
MRIQFPREIPFRFFHAEAWNARRKERCGDGEQRLEIRMEPLNFLSTLSTGIKGMEGITDHPALLLSTEVQNKENLPPMNTDAHR